DLYYRLNVVPLNLPALRERKEDLPGLANYFLKRSALETKKNFTGVTDDALRKLIAYEWPGNVRELANVVESAVVLGRGPELTLDDLPAKIVSTMSKGLRAGITYHGAIDDYRRELIEKPRAQPQEPPPPAEKSLAPQKPSLSRLKKVLRFF